MEFEWSATQKDLIRGVVTFAKSELGLHSVERDTIGKFSSEGWQKCAQMGLMGLPIDEAYGGSGVDVLTTTRSLEALSYGCKDNGLVHAIITQLLSGLTIEHFGSVRQKESYLPEICRGETITAQAITEPDAGSDVMAMTTKASKNAHSYTIQGCKTFISNAPIADVVVVFAASANEKQKINRISCFIVENKTQGFSRSKPLEKMGLRTMQSGELIFENCSIPKSNLLGKEGQGSLIMNEILQYEKMFLSACHIGIIQRILEETIEYANQREQFGEPIAKFQSISHKIANMKVNLEVGRQILYKTAWMKDQNKRPILDASIAKLFISEAYKTICLDALQIHGAYGYTKEFRLEQEVRDSLASTIYAGTSEIQRNIIASLIGL